MLVPSYFIDLNTEKMAKLLLLWSLLVTVIGASAQQCTIERFEGMVIDIVKATELSGEDQNINVTINSTFYNCLSTSQIIGVYNSMSVSILYIRSDTPDQLREVRYNLQCSGNIWLRAGQLSNILRSNNTRRDCSDCTDQNANDYHCTRKFPHCDIM